MLGESLKLHTKPLRYVIGSLIGLSETQPPSGRRVAQVGGAGC